jgi:hypothetical protein
MRIIPSATRAVIRAVSVAEIPFGETAMGGGAS